MSTANSAEVQANPYANMVESIIADLPPTGLQKKIVEAGGISPLVLSLSFGFPALQAAAAKCLHSLALDAEYLELVVEAGALTTLTTLLGAEKVEHSVQAAAAEALGAIIKDEHMAADAIPILVKMMCSGITEVCVVGYFCLRESHQSFL